MGLRRGATSHPLCGRGNTQTKVNGPERWNESVLRRSREGRLAHTPGTAFTLYHLRHIRYGKKILIGQWQEGDIKEDDCSMFRKRTNMRWCVRQIDWGLLLFKLIKAVMEGNYWGILFGLKALSYTHLSRLGRNSLYGYCIVFVF